MSLYADTQTALRTQLGGSLPRFDPYAIPPSSAIYAQNSSFFKGQAQSRLGHSVAFTVNAADGPCSSLYNWSFVLGVFPLPVTQISIAAYYAPAIGVRGYQQFPISITPVLFAVTGAAGASLVGAGTRLYGAFYDATGRLGIAQAEVYTWDNGTDTLFSPPLTIVPTMAETAAGVVTAGVHKIGYLFTTRSGYTGKLSPVNSSTVFVPATFTSTGAHNLQVTIAGALPAYLNPPATFQVVMTTVANPNQYFAVPGAVASAFNPTVITVNISDDDLAATGTDVTAYVNLLSQTVLGAGPFSPSAMFAYSSRMGYVTIDGAGVPVIYFSNQNAFQYITADQHGIYLEGNAKPVQGFSLRGVCYIGTPFSFFSTEDSGDVPVNWTPPQKVDGSIGILSPTCLTVNPALGYAGIASDRGFYIFQGGIFPALPLSYYQANDWNRINWQVPTTVQVVDDQLNKRFIVVAPLNNKVGSVSGTGPYVITPVITPHLYQSNLKVSIAGVTGNQTITVIDANTFSIPGGSGAPTVNGAILPQTATHEMTWDYTDGDTPETVKYSINAFGAFNVGAVAVIQNVTNYLQEIWYVPSLQGVGIRQNDGTEALPYRDVSTTGSPASYSWLYETSLLPGASDAPASMMAPAGSTLHQFCGAHLRLTGNGSGANGLTLNAFGIDHKISVVPTASPLTLSPNPGKEYLVKWALMSEQQSIQFGMTVMDSNAVLSLIRAYYTDYCPQR